jgi:dTDP-4-dehydrorhamnose 3,5-epimerase
MGAVFDVAVDLRRDSPTFKQWIGATLTAENREMLAVPPGCAHGYLTLVDNTEVFYQVSAYYAPTHAAGVRWNDPAFGIRWPGEVTVIADRDRDYPDFT